MVASSIYDKKKYDLAQMIYNAVGSYNLSVHSVYKHIPADILHGKHELDRIAVKLGVVPKYTIEQEYDLLRMKYQEHQLRNKELAKEHNDYYVFKKHDKVLMKIRSESKKKDKLEPRYIGPYEVLERKSEWSYLIAKIHQERLGDYDGKPFKVNVRLLKPY